MKNPLFGGRHSFWCNVATSGRSVSGTWLWATNTVLFTGMRKWLPWWQLSTIRCWPWVAIIMHRSVGDIWWKIACLHISTVCVSWESCFVRQLFKLYLEYLTSNAYTVGYAYAKTFLIENANFSFRLYVFIYMRMAKMHMKTSSVQKRIQSGRRLITQQTTHTVNTEKVWKVGGVLMFCCFEDFVFIFHF